LYDLDHAIQEKMKERFREFILDCQKKHQKNIRNGIEIVENNEEYLDNAYIDGNSIVSDNGDEALRLYFTAAGITTVVAGATAGGAAALAALETAAVASVGAVAASAAALVALPIAAIWTGVKMAWTRDG